MVFSGLQLSLHSMVSFLHFQLVCQGRLWRREAVLTLDKPAGNASVPSWNARTDLTLFVRQMPKFLPVGKLLRIANDELIPLCPSPL